MNMRFQRYIFCRKLAAEMLGGASKLPHFDWEVPRSREGYYKVRGGVDYCVARAM